jgi:hypothetical protein
MLLLPLIGVRRAGEEVLDDGGIEYDICARANVLSRIS